ncbi:hypothetical protein [Arthrobacter sp. TMS1-12-1]
MNIELQAVTQIIDMVSSCPHLEPYLDWGDRTPFTDGHIDIHSSLETHANSNFVGRVGVQVKGRKFEGALKYLPRSFSIKKVDLEGYLKTHGVLYFVVHINPKTGKRHPTYILLNPYKIQLLIKEMGKRKSVSIPTKPLPSDSSKIEKIVQLALQTTNENPNARIDYTQLSDLSRITLYTDGELNLDAPITLNHRNYDFSLVIETTGGASVYVDQVFTIVPEEYVSKPTDLIVASGDFKFSHPTRRRVNDRTFELQLSEGLKIQLSGPDGTSPAPANGTSPAPANGGSPASANGGSPALDLLSSGTVSLVMAPTLRERFNDLGFYLACMETAVFKVNGTESKFEVNSDSDLKDLQEHFEYLKTLVTLFDELGVNSNLIEMDALDDKRRRQIVGLYDVMIQGRDISSAHHEMGRIAQPVGNWHLQLIVLPNGEGEKWMCNDLFDPKLQQQFALSFEDDEGEAEFTRVTPYDFMETEQLPFILNLHLDGLVEAYSNVFEYNGAGSRANATVLKLIHAADVVYLRKTEFLDAASALNEWLLSKEGDRSHHLINRWQIAVREEKVTQDDRFGIRSLRDKAIKHEVDMPLLVETSCAILLGDAEEFAYCTSRLDEDQLTEIQKWPIWTLRPVKES